MILHLFIQIIIAFVLMFAVVLFSIILMTGTNANKQEKNTTIEDPTENEVKRSDEPDEVPNTQETEKKFPQMQRLEILYWRAVSQPWRWNNYAEELLEYAQNYLPIRKLDDFATYNSNSRSKDYSLYTNRIEQLKKHKISKHPLVVLNYNEDFMMITSKADLEYMKDWIDAEWMRQYQCKKTYR